MFTRFLLITACTITASAFSAHTQEQAKRKFFCVPTHALTCANKSLPLYQEGCQSESGPEGPLTLTLDLELEQARFCWKSDGKCNDEAISVEDVHGDAYIVRNASGQANQRNHGMLDISSMSYAETLVTGAANKSLLASVDFYKCTSAM
jgi:hypothetical protein